MAERHPSTTHLLSLFECDHLPEHLQRIARPLQTLAVMTTNQLQDGPELTAGLRKMLEAKDCMVRQAVIDTRTGDGQ